MGAASPLEASVGFRNFAISDFIGNVGEYLTHGDSGNDHEDDGLTPDERSTNEHAVLNVVDIEVASGSEILS